LATAGAAVAAGLAAVPAQAAVAPDRAVATHPSLAVAALAPSPSLVNRAVQAGINLPSTPSWDVQPVDYDNDGLQDFSISLHMKNAGQLLRNNGDGTFSRVANTGSPATTIMPRPNAQGGLVDRHACTWADFDRNGRKDLYCEAGRYSSNRYKTESINNELWMQSSVGAFSDAATSAGVGEPCTRGRHPAAIDFNGDGWLDLFVGAQAERNASGDPCNSEDDYPYNEQSKVYINQGTNANGVWLGFSASRSWNVSAPNTGNRMALPWDYNHDGRTDLLSLSFASKGSTILRNTGTGLVSATAGSIGIPTYNWATLAYIDNDNLLDFVYADNAGFAYRLGTTTGVSTTTVRIGTISSGVGWRVAVGDINGDGRLDVYGLVASSSGSTNPPDFVFVRTATGGWERHEVPGAGGDANAVAPVRVGVRDQFVVLNGGNGEKLNPGPVQLIAWAG
jgi:hypothetical protein